MSTQAAIQGAAVRVDETRQELTRLSEECAAWLERLKVADKKRRAHTTRLANLEAVLTTLLSRVSDEVGGIELGLAADGDTGAALSEGGVYEHCRTADVRTSHIRRVWGYFADRFAQRTTGVADMLDAADEVVWSCYAQAFVDQAGVTRPPSAPLACVEPAFAPRALARDTPPAELKSADRLLREHLARLPVPIIGVPPVCQARPWWLVLLAHECGHHIQHDLPGGAVGGFATLVADAAGAAGSVADAEQWKGWSQELFADTCAVLLAGPAAAWAMAELEHADAEQLETSDDPAYPPPAVRAAYMAAVLAEVGVAPGGVEITTDQCVQAVAKAAVGPPVSDGTPLPTLCGFRAEEFGPGGAVAGWSDALRSESALVGSTDIDSARLCVAGGIDAWRALLATTAPDDLAAARARLASRLLGVLPLCRAEGVRAAPDRGHVDAAATAIADSLLDADPRDLEAW